MKHYQSKNVRIFVSSTFVDLSEERDYLIHKVFPLVKEYALQRGVVISEIDLRWGLSKEDSRSGKVVNLCLHEIENCRPFFVGIVGARYGWIPGDKEYESLDDRISMKNDVAQLFYKGLSVTEMEFRYSLSDRNGSCANVFFVKDVDNDEIERLNSREESEKLLSLRADLLDNNNIECSMYSDVEDLGNQLINKLIKFIDLYFPIDDCSEEDRLTTYGNEYRIASLAQISNLFQSQQAIIENIVDRIDSGTCHVGIEGAYGMGKTVILSSLAQRLDSRYNVVFIPAIQHEKNFDVESFREYVLKDVGISNKESVLIIDDIDNLWFVSEKVLLDLMDEFKTVIFSFCPNFYLKDVLHKYGVVLSIQNYSIDELKSVALNMLNEHGKNNVSTAVIENMVITSEQSISTIKMLIRELLWYGSFETYEALISEWSNKEDGELYKDIIANWERAFGMQTMKAVLLSVSLSQRGLSEDEIKDIFSFPQLLWSQVYCAIKPYLSEDTGFLYIKDKMLLTKILEYWSLEDLIEMRTRLSNYFLAIKSFRALRECVFQLFSIHKEWSMNCLYDSLKELDTFEQFHSNKLESELVHYWIDLMEYDASYTPMIYTDINTEKTYVDRTSIDKLEGIRLIVFEFIAGNFQSQLGIDNLNWVIKRIAMDRDLNGVLQAKMTDDYRYVPAIYSYSVSKKYTLDGDEICGKSYWLDNAINRYGDKSFFEREEIAAIFDACLDRIEVVLIQGGNDVEEMILYVIRRAVECIPFLENDYGRIFRLFIICVYLNLTDEVDLVIDVANDSYVLSAFLDLMRYIKDVYCGDSKEIVDIYGIERGIRKEFGRENEVFRFLMEQFAMALIADGKATDGCYIINQTKNSIESYINLKSRKGINRYDFTPVTEKNFPLACDKKELKLRIHNYYVERRDLPRALYLSETFYSQYKELMKVKTEIIKSYVKDSMEEDMMLVFYLMYPELAFPPFLGSDLRLSMEQFDIECDKDTILENYEMLYALFHDEIKDFYSPIELDELLDDGKLFVVVKNVRIILFKVWSYLIQLDSELKNMGYIDDKAWLDYIDNGELNETKMALLAIMSIDIELENLLIAIDQNVHKKYPYVWLKPLLKGKCRCDTGYVSF